MKGANRKRVKQALLIKTYLVRSRVMAALSHTAMLRAGRGAGSREGWAGLSRL